MNAEVNEEILKFADKWHNNLDIALHTFKYINLYKIAKQISTSGKNRNNIIIIKDCVEEINHYEGITDYDLCELLMYYHEKKFIELSKKIES